MGRAAACGLALLMIAASCLRPGRSAFTPATAGTTPSARSGPASLEVAWVNDQLRPIGQPETVGAFAVGIVSAPDRKLLLVGLDPATGRALWQQPLTPSAVTPGVSVVVTHIGKDKVAYLRPTSVDSGYAELVLADAATGADVAKTPEALFTSTPYPCGGGEDVCATSTTVGATQSVAHRLEAATGRYVVEGDRVPPGARLIAGGGLFDLGDRPGNTLALLRDGEVVWRTPVSAAFPPGFTTDHGWNWNRFREEHVFVGSVGGPIVFDGPLKITRDLASTSATAALSEIDGSVLWRDGSSSFHCHLVTGDQPVRCRWRGTVKADNDVITSFQDIDVTIEGFDVRTGRTTWAVPMGGETSLVAGDARPPIAGATQVVLEAPAGPIVLDFATGKVSPPLAGATFWCTSDQRYEFSQGYQFPGQPVRHLRPGGVLAAVCDAHAQPATALPSTAATAAIGAHLGNYLLVAVKDGGAGVERFVGFRLSPGPADASAR